MIDLTTTTPFKAFYSDPHFGHHNIIAFCDRPYRSARHMTSELIENYNKLIDKDDWVCWVGDCFFGHNSEEGRLVLDKMNGQKVLVRGNHDGSNSKMTGMGFALVVDELFLKISDQLCRVNHYPYKLTDKEVARLRKEGKNPDQRYPDRRPPRTKGEVLIHGHTHSAEKFRDRMIHVGIDAWNFGPALVTEVADIITGY